MNDVYDFSAMTKTKLVLVNRALASANHQLAKKATGLYIENVALKKRLQLIEQHREAFQIK